MSFRKVSYYYNVNCISGYTSSQNVSKPERDLLDLMLKLNAATATSFGEFIRSHMIVDLRSSGPFCPPASRMTVLRKKMLANYTLNCTWNVNYGVLLAPQQGLE